MRSMIAVVFHRAGRLFLVCMLLALTALAGCRDTEENRQITTVKGEYQGPSDTPLTAEQRRKLQARGGKQKF